MTSWRYEIAELTRSFEDTLGTPLMRQILMGSKKELVWPDQWRPYFGENTVERAKSNPNWLEHPVVAPYTLVFVRSNRWFFTPTAGGFLGSFDPGGLVETKEPRGMHGKVHKDISSLDFRCPFRYAEDRHKDDIATLKKKWKYL